MATHPPERVVVENVNVPGHTQSVDATMYREMRRAFLAILPGKAPGLTQTEIRALVVPKLVQLDLEAKGVVVREDSKPLRWHRCR